MVDHVVGPATLSIRERLIMAQKPQKESVQVNIRHLAKVGQLIRFQQDLSRLTKPT